MFYLVIGHLRPRRTRRIARAAMRDYLDYLLKAAA